MWIYYTMKYAIRWYCSIVQLHVFQWVYHCFAGGSTCLVCWLCSLPGKSEDPPLPSGNGGGRTEVNKWFVFLPLWCFFLYGFGVKLKNTYYTGAKEINRVASTNFQNEQFSLQSVLYQIEQAWKILKQFPKLFRPWRHHGPTNWWSSRSNICIKRADMDTFSSFTRTHLFIYIYIYIQICVYWQKDMNRMNHDKSIGSPDFASISPKTPDWKFNESKIEPLEGSSHNKQLGCQTPLVLSKHKVKVGPTPYVTYGDIKFECAKTNYWHKYRITNYYGFCIWIIYFLV